MPSSHDLSGYSSFERDSAIGVAERTNMPHRALAFRETGTLIVMGRREGYRFWDVDGREFIDFHLNGGVFNLGHRNATIVERMKEALDYLDMGNHHFLSPMRARVAHRLLRTTSGRHSYVVFTSGGGEAIDVAIRSARRATGRRHIVTIAKGFHGRTGLSGAAGDANTAERFFSDFPADFSAVPYNDVDAIAAALASTSSAAVLLETVPATMGFVPPADGYLERVRHLCDQHGALLIADEIQTGLMRSGQMWAIDTYGVNADIIVTGKGLGGGIYPVAAAILTRKAGAWLETDGWGYVASASGSELGMVAADAVLDILEDPATHSRVANLIGRLTVELANLAETHPFIDRIYERGLIVGIKTADSQGGAALSRALHDIGLWAYPASYDKSVLQFKTGLLLDDDLLGKSFELLEQALTTVQRQNART